MEINTKRVWERIHQLSCIGATKHGGVSRFAFSLEDRQATDLVIKWMKEANLHVTSDSLGNVYGRRKGKREGPPVLAGSHLDTVPNGGKFDGVAGVIAALEVLQVFEENDIITDLPIEMVIFVNEEGSRFAGGLMGSMGIAGRLDNSIVDSLIDNEGVILRDAMKSFGAKPDEIHEAVRTKGDYTAFFELHIEQGEVLESQDIPVGIVNGIAGPYQMKVSIYGRSGHAGATPMGLRKDPMVAAGMVIQEVERSALEEGKTIRGTVGFIKAYPGGHNVIPEKVEFTLDYRDINPQNRIKAVNRIKDYIDDICENRSLKYDIITTQNTQPILLNENIVSLMESSAHEYNIPAFIMPSGAAHDAMNLHALCPTGMIFIRSKNGLSHCPEEYSTEEDVALGTKLLLSTIQKSADGYL
ncbi:M20 family metallo-hydrolase [Evansella cellulosilytica]|uniref:Amidase, hydantoinase/carbamoylase family n=1 Tax=Evansella cellulosilytica (strain ATCC 21833 / DSM 2522 / FERM P-1141 / JCM 9156 / N-4) TaxID=649639 RepID=E6TTV0_EVAC2|nr:M20 family metallo-hydrolase [Evansella cellulosilytica]ADU31981.1 amidase, hydantoinase/carbamoylase family [Evansella cellulosilytica DSM 2522]